MKTNNTRNLKTKNLSFFSLAIILSFLFTSNTVAQSVWNYISPVPNSTYLNPENNIVFRNGDIININSVSKDCIQVVGTKSGQISGKIKLSTDKRTLLFIPDSHFQYGEQILATLKAGILTNKGDILEEANTTFSIKRYELPIENNITDIPISIKQNNTNEDSPILYSHNNLIHYGTASLPSNYPTPEILAFDNPSSKYAFYGVEPQNDDYGYYATIVDNYGTPIFYREWHDKTPSFQVVADNQLVHKNTEDGVFDKNSFIVMDDKYNIIDTLKVGNGYKTNTHDMLMLENGNHYLMIYDAQPIGMDTVVTGGNPNATVKGFVLQELDPDHNVIFQWRSWDHYNITDANHVDLTAAIIDYVHVNAYDTTSDGNILLCCRHFDEVTKINRNTGEIIWRFGPKAQNNMFEFTNDTMGFTYAHDIQQLANGNLTLYDNGNYHNPPFSRSIEYEIDEANLKATLVWEYSNDPIIYGRAKGGSRRLDNGNTIIGWGQHFPIISTEAAYNGNKVWELSLDSCVSYRVMKFDWKTSVFETNVDSIDFGYYNGYEPWPVIFSVTNNVDYDIEITSATNHSFVFYLETSLPLEIGVGETKNMIVYFFPEWMEEQDFSDVLTLNYDGFYNDTLQQRISRQIFLKGTTIDHSSVNDITGNNISIYPNPANDFVKIVSDLNKINKLTIYSLTGSKLEVINNINNQDYTIDIRSYKPGIYFLDVNVDGLSQDIKSKIIVE